MPGFLTLASILIAVLPVLFTGGAGGDGYVFSVTADDQEGHSNSIQFGVHPRATYGFDMELGELPIPPPPAVPAFDLRFLDPLKRKQWPGNGAYKDIRPLVSRTQVDTFYIGFQPANGSYPVTFIWPLGLAEYCDSAFVMVQRGDSTQTVSMLARNTLSIEDPSVSSLVLITHGVRFAGQGAESR